MAKKRKKTIKKTSPKLVEEKPKILPEGVKKTRIRVIGIGGGGGTIVSEIAARTPRATFVVANTDRQALRTSSRKVIRFQFGQTLTQGLGTGMNAELGWEAAQSDKDKIKKLLEGQDLCILVACLGGGAGSGAIPVFAKLSKSLGNITYGIFTLPFKFEGEKKMEIARDSLKKVKNYLNAITLIPNERVFQIIDKATPLKQALSVINKSLTESLGGLIETIYEPGLINIDFADLKTILEGRGRLAYLNTVEVRRKEGSTKDLVTKVLTSPLYPYSIRGAKGVLFNIAGEKKLSLAEVNQISKTIADLANSEAKIIFGISQSQKYSDTIKTIVLATGCGMKIFPSKPKKKRKKRKKKKPIKKTPTIKKKKEVVPPPEKVIKPKRKKKRKRKKSKPSQKPVKQRKRRRRVKRVKRSLIGAVKKVKIKVIKKTKKELPTEPEVEAETKPDSNQNFGEENVRKNGLQIKKEAEEVEKEMQEKEKFWERPAFLRRKNK